MNMTTRELREALKLKLDERRALMGENRQLRADVRHEKDRNDLLTRLLRNPMIDRVLEDCADAIMKRVMDEAVKASEIVARETMDTGNYEIGISIPSLHIRHCLYRMDDRPFDYRDPVPTEPVKRINVGPSSK